LTQTCTEINASENVTPRLYQGPWYLFKY